MKKCGIFLVINLLFFLNSDWSYAQEDTIKKDTIKAYKEIEAYSQKNKFTKTIHKLLFKSVNTKPTKKSSGIQKNRIYTEFDGKIIRNITIETLDPFGYSVTDTSKKPNNFVSNAGNFAHIKTRNWAIQNLLLIQKNKPLDSLKMRESERLIRTQRYVRAVEMQTYPVGITNDSVDVTIIVLDSWSLIPNITPTPNRTTYEITERNILGTGHEWDNTFRQNQNDGKNAFSTQYTIPNIKNTYIRTQIFYRNDLENNSNKGINIERKFYSPLTKWAGGILSTKTDRTDTLPDANFIFERQRIKFDTHDFWVGRSFRINNDKSVDHRVTNLILSTRYQKIDYFESPEFAFDSLNVFSDEKLFLNSIGLSYRSFVKDSYLFNYGIVEDVPIGKVYALTGGYQFKNNSSRFYLGGRVSLGNYFSWGYLSHNFEYGSFFRDGRSEQNAFTIQNKYFTNLIEVGKWKIRQFFNADLIIGNRRLASYVDQLSINEDNGIQGFNSPLLFGTKKIVLGFQTQTYSPWDLAGFRFSPFFNYTIAMLGDGAHGFKKSEAFSKIGLGVIITNDYLVFNSFQISFAYYPKIPFEGEQIFKTNSFRTTDFGFQNFEIDKPQTVIYQ